MDEDTEWDRSDSYIEIVGDVDNVLSDEVSRLQSELRQIRYERSVLKKTQEGLEDSLLRADIEVESKDKRSQALSRELQKQREESEKTANERYQLERELASVQDKLSQVMSSKSPTKEQGVLGIGRKPSSASDASNISARLPSTSEDGRRDSFDEVEDIDNKHNDVNDDNDIENMDIQQLLLTYAQELTRIKQMHQDEVDELEARIAMGALLSRLGSATIKTDNSDVKKDNDTDDKNNNHNDDNDGDDDDDNDNDNVNADDDDDDNDDDEFDDAVSTQEETSHETLPKDNVTKTQAPKQDVKLNALMNVLDCVGCTEDVLLHKYIAELGRQGIIVSVTIPLKRELRSMLFSLEAKGDLITRIDEENNEAPRLLFHLLKKT